MCVSEDDDDGTEVEEIITIDDEEDGKKKNDAFENHENNKKYMKEIFIDDNEIDEYQKQISEKIKYKDPNKDKDKKEISKFFMNVCDCTRQLIGEFNMLINSYIKNKEYIIKDQEYENIILEQLQTTKTFLQNAHMLIQDFKKKIDRKDKENEKLFNKIESYVVKSIFDLRDINDKIPKCFN